MSHYIDFDKGTFTRGYYKQEKLVHVVDEEPEYLQYLLDKDDLRPPLTLEEREALIEALESVGE